jgi:phosphatidylinositol alpha-1,6-mannosyltransferase
MLPELLIITRNYPPRTGGLENFSFNLVRELKRHFHVQVVALAHGKRHLAWFLPWALCAGLAAARRGSTPRIHLCDGLLAPIGRVLKLCSRSRVSASVHGLDVTFPRSLYQRIAPSSLRHLDRIVCVSRSTRDECLKRGVPAERCSVIPNGVRAEEVYLTSDRRDLVREAESCLGRSFAGKTILLTVGRLVKRKGVQWFVERVLPRLDPDYVYIVVGIGPELAAIQEAVRRCNLGDRVVLAGRQTDRQRNCLLNIADVFIMPNISIPGDVEGFGIAALEAGACGVPVIASDIQGLCDAVVDGITGHLVKEKDAEGFVARIAALGLDRGHIRSTVISRFSWERIGREYVRLLTPSNSDIA